MLSESIKESLREDFNKSLKDNVEVVFRRANNDLSKKVETLLKEVSSLSDKIKLTISDKLNCYDYPCISFKKEDKEIGIKYMGNIDGGEFKTFIDSIKLVSSGEVELEDRTLDFIKEIDKPVNIKVFITLSCGWCPPAVLKCYNFALASDFIETTAIECFSFPDFANKYSVITVPKIVINDKEELIGYKTENEILGAILSSIS
ncbi:MAG: glutaredoxin [Persephonella sp.]|nr:MAG: glutaredoxin [Persephonella sp.]